MSTRTVTPEEAERVIRRVMDRVADDLRKPQELEHKFAQAILTQAVSNAASKPTPQAQMAADNLRLQGSEIGPLAGGAPAEVAGGSEFGSDIYLQFQRAHNSRGYWLYPAAESSNALGAADRALEDILQRAVHRG